MSELLNGEVAPETQAQPAEDLETGAELATDSDGEHKEKPQVDEAADKKAATQQLINDRIGKVTFQAKQAERERDELREQIAKRDEEDRAAEAARAGDIPSIPNELDDDFAEKMAERDAAIRRQTQFEASQANYQQQQKDQQALAQQQVQAEQQKTLIAYNARAAELSIDAQELQAAENAIVSFGVTGDLASHIMSDPDGPLIVKELAANPSDAMTLINLSPFQQGAYLDQIKAKAEALKPKPTNTPAPSDVLTGSGAQVDAGKYPNSGGATFS